MDARQHIVTGAFSYTGKYITRRLLARGDRVKTLTAHSNHPSPFGDRVVAARFNFDRPEALVASLRGADTLFNTYWIRFPYGKMTYERAVANTETIIEAAREAGVRRLVHISIANADADSRLPYFRRKGLVEQAIRRSGLSYAILRPTVIFGPEGILINNIAWLLRKFPIFAIPGSGAYRLQPIFVEDVATMAVAAADQADNLVCDAAGPETFTFRHLVRQIAGVTHSRALLVRVPPALALALTDIIGRMVCDVILTRDEVVGLMANLLVSAEQPRGTKRLTEWLRENSDKVGRRYASELARHYRS